MNSEEQAKYDLRAEALRHAMTLHAEYEHDAKKIIEAAQKFEAYLKGEVTLDASRKAA